MIAFCGPPPGRRGGVQAVLRALVPRVDRAERATVVPPRHASAVVLNPSLRPRSLARDLAVLATWRGPAAVWVHGGSPSGWRRSLPILRRVADRAILVVLAERFGARLVHAGVPAERVRVVPPCYEPSEVAGADGRGRDVLFLGRLVREKGVDVLIEAFARVGAGHLVLAGTGPLRGGLAERARALGIADRVILPGWIEGSAKRGALQSAAVVALPSLDEAVPIALIEAMASGVPVVATEVGAVPETVGGAGRLCPPGDVDALAAALARVLERPGDRGRIGLERAQRYHPRVVAAQWSAILDELC